MRIEQLNQLLQAKRPGAVATVPGAVRSNGSALRRTVVSVVFVPGGRVYEYRGYLYEVAERLGLIEARDMRVIAQRVVAGLRHERAVVDHIGALDTIRALHGVDVTTEPAGSDEYGRLLARYIRA